MDVPTILGNLFLANARSIKLNWIWRIFVFSRGQIFFFFFLDCKVTVKSSNERFEGYMIEHDDYEHGFSRIWRDCYSLLGKNFSNK